MRWTVIGHLESIMEQAGNGSSRTQTKQHIIVAVLRWYIHGDGFAKTAGNGVALIVVVCLYEALRHPQNRYKRIYGELRERWKKKSRECEEEPSTRNYATSEMYIKNDATGEGAMNSRRCLVWSLVGLGLNWDWKFRVKLSHKKTAKWHCCEFMTFQHYKGTFIHLVPIFITVRHW